MSDGINRQRDKEMLAGPGLARRSEAERCAAKQCRHSEASLGRARQGKAMQAWHGLA